MEEKGREDDCAVQRSTIKIPDCREYLFFISWLMNDTLFFIWFGLCLCRGNSVEGTLKLSRYPSLTARQ